MGCTQSKERSDATSKAAAAAFTPLSSPQREPCAVSDEVRTQAIPEAQEPLTEQQQATASPTLTSVAKASQDEMPQCVKEETKEEAIAEEPPVAQAQQPKSVKKNGTSGSTPAEARPTAAALRTPNASERKRAQAQPPKPTTRAATPTPTTRKRSADSTPNTSRPQSRSRSHRPGRAPTPVGRSALASASATPNGRKTGLSVARNPNVQRPVVGAKKSVAFDKTAEPMSSTQKAHRVKERVKRVTGKHYSAVKTDVFLEQCAAFERLLTHASTFDAQMNSK